MDIGEPVRIIEVEPATKPKREPTPTPAPVPAKREPVPAGR